MISRASLLWAKSVRTSGHTIWRYKRRSLRPYSTRRGSRQRLQIPIHNSGHIDVDIYLPPQPSGITNAHSNIVSSETSVTTKHTDVLFNLPTLPSDLLRSSQIELVTGHVTPIRLARLAEATLLPVIQPHYRLAPDYPYPTPVHDTAVAFDWAVRWMRAQRKDDEESAPPQEATAHNLKQINVGLTGDMIGGSLALALGLTECRLADSARVVAISVREPLLDWVFEYDPRLQRSERHTLEDDEGSKQRARGSQTRLEATVDAFHVLRHRSFPGRDPYKYFDSFASPMHFLRSPSGRVPSAYTNGNPLDLNLLGAGFEDVDEDVQDADETQMEDEKYARTMGAADPSRNSQEPLSPSASSTSEGSTQSSAAEIKIKRPMALDDPRRFKRPRRYPPADHAQAMMLPRLKISTHSNSLLKAHAEEFIRLLRRGLLRGRGYKMSKEVERMIMDDGALTEQEQHQANHPFKDERLQILRQGMQIFQLEVDDQTKTLRDEREADWFLGR